MTTEGNIEMAKPSTKNFEMTDELWDSIMKEAEKLAKNWEAVEETNEIVSIDIETGEVVK